MGFGRLRSHLFLAVVAAAVLAACASHAVIPPVMQTAAGPADAIVVLRLNHEAELKRFVGEISDPRSPRFRRFLTLSQFEARYAPTQRQHDQVVRSLRAAGFTILRTYPDRAILDVRTPRNARLPGSLSPLVAHVLVAAPPRGRIVSFARTANVGRPKPVPTVEAVRNGSFESRLRGWKACDTVTLSKHALAGKYSALVGSKTPDAGNVHGVQTLCQKVVIPHDAVLHAHTYSVTNVHDVRRGGYQEIGFTVKPGRPGIVLFKGLTNKRHWEPHTWSLSSLEGRVLYLYFAVVGHGQQTLYDSMYVDAVKLTGTVPTATPSTPPTPVGPGPGTPLTGPTFGPNGQWAPRAVADAFDFPVQHGYDGRGTTVAFVSQSALRASDLAAFFNANGITRKGKFVETAVAGGAGSGDPTEAMLDAETIGALAPGSDVIAYEIPSFSSTYVIDAYQTAINQNKAKVVLNSDPFAQCETDDRAFDDTIESEAISAAAIGITFVAASGDQGSACYSERTSSNIAGMSAIASIPHVLAVGGNASHTPGPMDTPLVWAGDNGFEVGASGGGVSKTWPLPSYQKGVAGLASGTRRNLPDIAFPAIGDDLYLDGADEVTGGTSWSSSIAAALLAESVEICGPLGFVNPSAYALIAKGGEGTSLLDVTSGKNAFAAFKAYAASAGYDNASGIGMPYGIKFAAAVCGRSTSLVRFH
ncbi:MAG TPA: S53 family serine peptidase [Candidatus Baltobacteraceae bacterium]|nr:S53 family serine peptidase [Candidatus Baltobacteraceae bacterium]